MLTERRDFSPASESDDEVDDIGPEYCSFSYTTNTHIWYLLSVAGKGACSTSWHKNAAFFFFYFLHFYGKLLLTISFTSLPKSDAFLHRHSTASTSFSDAILITPSYSCFVTTAC